MYPTNKKRRLCNLESAMLESQLARIDAHYRGLPGAELDLIIEIADSQITGAGREFSSAEIGLYERHCEFWAQFPESVQKEYTRRDVAEMLAAGQITRDDVIKELGPEYLPR